MLDLVHRGIITTPYTADGGDLVELNELFNLYWPLVVPLGQTSSIDEFYEEFAWQNCYRESQIDGPLTQKTWSEKVR